MEGKKYSEMTFEEFITEILGFKPTEQQLHMIRMFEENKIKKIEYVGNWFNTKDNFNPNIPMYTTCDLSDGVGARKEIK